MLDMPTIIARQGLKGPKTVAVAAAEDDLVLRAVREAYDLGVAKPVLFGRKKEIRNIAAESDIDVSPFEIRDAETPQAAARQAVACVRSGEADILMKGLLQTAELLHEVLHKERGLRTGQVLSHVSILRDPDYDRVVLLTDPAMIIAPDLKMKIWLIENSVQVAHGVGIKNPKVAVVTAVEVVNPSMPATTDAALLTIMNKRGQIKGCVVDGPMALDLAISPQAVQHKHFNSQVAGKADILLFPNIEAANSVLKTLVHIGGFLFGGIVVGATCPLVITSRSDSADSKLYSLVCAAAMSDKMVREKKD